MAYVKTVWEDNKTPLDAANLNKIEEGIENAVSLSETNEKDISILDGQVAALETGKQDKLTAGTGITLTNNTLAVADAIARVDESPDDNRVPVLLQGGGWSSLVVTENLSGLTVPKRTITGQLKADDPTEKNDLTTKQYVDKQYEALNKYLPTVDSWVAGGTIPGAHTISLGDVTYSEKIPKLLVLDLNLNRSGSSGGTCSIKAVLEAHDLTDPQQKSTQQLFNESADGTLGDASITGKIILEHDDTDSYFQWKNIYVMYDHYVGGNHVKHSFQAFQNNAAYYGELKLAITVLAMSERKSTVIKQYANKE